MFYKDGKYDLNFKDPKIRSIQTARRDPIGRSLPFFAGGNNP